MKQIRLETVYNCIYASDYTWFFFRSGVLLSIADAFAAARASLDLGLKVTECRLDR